MKNQIFKKISVFFLAIILLVFAYLIGTQHSKKIRVVVSQDTNLIQNWSDKVRPTIVYPKRDDEITLDYSSYPIALRLYPKDHYLWIEVGTIAILFNEDYSDISFFRNENKLFNEIYHEVRDKDNNRRTQWFHPLLDYTSPMSPSLTCYSHDAHNSISYSSHSDNKIINYRDDNMDGIWDTMTIKENDVSNIYKYDLHEKRWYNHPTGVLLPQNTESNAQTDPN